MAEIALAGTVIGLVATGAHLVVRLANFVEAVKDAPESILDVLNELESVNDTLQELKAPIQIQQGHLSQSLTRKIARVTQDCTTVFSKLKKLIDKLGHPGGKASKFFFVFYADNISAARSSLQAQKASLTLILQLALKSDSSTIISLIERLVAKRDATAIPTRSQEVARDLISDVASSVGMRTIPPLPQAESVSIEPEEPAAPPENAEAAQIESRTESSELERSSSFATEEQSSDRGENVQEDPAPKPLRRFDTDEPEKVTEDGIALVMAADRGDLEMVTLLLEFDVSPNSIGGNQHSPLQAAAFSGHVEVVKLLIEKGAKVGQLGPAWGSPLHAAVKTGRLEVVKVLLDAKADPDGDAVLVTAAERGDLRCVKYLLNYGANVEIRGGGPLQAAAFFGRLDVVKLLLAAGADAEATGPPWGSPLRAAVSTGKKDIARVLLEHKKGMK